MKFWKKGAALLLCFALMLAAFGCKPQDDGEKPVEPMDDAWLDTLLEETELYYGQGLEGTTTSTDSVLYVDLHSMMPTLDGTVSASKLIANKFEQLTGVKIKFVQNKPLLGEADEVSSWLINSVSAGTMPAISFSWSKFADRNYYMDLTDVVNVPNQFVEEGETGSGKWSDMFPDYLWSTSEILAANGRIVAVPVTLNPGPATAWYYNKKIFGEIEGEVPTKWSELVSLADRIAGTAGKDNDGRDVTYYGLAPYGNQKTVAFTNWATEFSIGPSFAKSIMDATDIDRDDDGKVSTNEELRGVTKGYFSPLQAKNPEHYMIARECYRVAKEYYAETLPSGWTNVEWQDRWNQGELGMIQNGIWQLTNERNNEAVHTQWDFGMFPAPLVDKSTSQYASDIDYSTGPFEPSASCFLNLMVDGIKGNKTVLKNAILFLQFLTTTDCVDAIIQEHGASLGATLGTTPSEQLAEWLTLPFPIVPNCKWAFAYTTKYNQELDSAFSKWVSGSMTDEDFYAKADEFQQAGAAAYISSLGIDTSEW